MSFDKVFSLDLIKEEKLEDDKWILDLIEERKIAKANKDYAKADEIRKNLYDKGIELLDTREGTTYKIIWIIVQWGYYETIKDCCLCDM